MKKELYDSDSYRFIHISAPYDLVHPDVFETKMRLFQEGTLFV